MESNAFSTQLILFSGIGVVIMMALGLLAVLLSNRVQKKLLHEQMEKQALELQHQEELLLHNIKVQEEERQRIAAQLHDDIGSKLGVLHLTLHRLRKTERETAQHDMLFEEINGLLSNTLDTTRRISHELMPPTLEGFGLIEAINEFCDNIRKTGAVEVTFEHNFSKPDLPNAQIELHLFRILQELVNNTLKYACAKNIAIQLIRSDQTIQLTYTDDGMGFDLDNTISRGLGLRNIVNRARMIGGVLYLESAPSKGFKANVNLDFNQGMSK